MCLTVQYPGSFWPDKPQCPVVSSIWDHGGEGGVSERIWIVSTLCLVAQLKNWVCKWCWFAGFKADTQLKERVVTSFGKCQNCFLFAQHIKPQVSHECQLHKHLNKQTSFPCSSSHQLHFLSVRGWWGRTRNTYEERMIILSGHKIVKWTMLKAR